MATSHALAVLLGVPQEECKAQTSWYHNKVGGSPDWMPSFASSPHPTCTLCKKQLFLVVQIYCPLIGSPYHRTVYVFACAEKLCQQDKSSSWSVLRMQQLAETEHENTAFCKPDAKEYVDDWADDADDWGSDEDCEEAENILESISKSSNETTSSSKCSTNVAKISVPTLDRLCLSEPDGSVDDRCFIPPRHMNVFAEPEAEDSMAGRHEEKLLQEYAEKEGLSADTNWNSLLASRLGESKSSEETYEKGLPTHGDTAFLKFTKRVRRCPEQCVRYCWSGRPLLMFSMKEDFQPPDCQYCGSLRVYEFQLMPSLIASLQSSVHADVSLDFGTVLMYTCSKSCWHDDAIIREECAIVQQDPDHEQIGHI